MELAAKVALLSSHVDQSRQGVDASLAGLQWVMHVLAREVHRGDDLVGFFHRGQGEALAFALDLQSLQSACDLSFGAIKEAAEMASEDKKNRKPGMRYDYSQEEMRAITEEMRKAYAVIHRCQAAYLRLVGLGPLSDGLDSTASENKVKQ